MKEDGLDLAPAKVLSEREDVVRVMSIHKSKGLEFPVVIAADMGKAFNRQDMHSLILFHNTLGIGLKQYDAQWRMAYPTLLWNGICAQIGWESTAEEERVLYVAMTRARDKLILTGHTSHLERDWQRWRGQVNPAGLVRISTGCSPASRRGRKARPGSWAALRRGRAGCGR